MSPSPNKRDIESDMHCGGPSDLSYAQYLNLDTLLSAQRTRSQPEHHDELSFAVDDLRAALKCMARVKQIQRQLFEQWAVLETLTPGEFVAFRDYREILHRPGLYDEFLRYLSRHGYEISAELLDRDFSQPFSENPKLLPVPKAISENPKDHWRAWETCKELPDMEEAFQLWRFRHMKAVERILGYKRGTGGSTGVVFLRAALELTFFPEILSVRNEIGQ
ncbi:tryptophan 2,3-dioxygenase [Streptomyces rhizosphaericus]|uniref:Tryptophan 2,3-dioxygenase n=1 Tax=Streptomyces rhizosphaericus TaxID=114699 RepID=A0A6G4ATQ2_9ACTN|nr:tryptophan 2,3-dioxygenase family protein [Streptomyces rhizosphaericus]NEW76642.1 tryptophan 2,3-dioxygenase [Streptomyces rhizosphaericus]